MLHRPAALPWTVLEPRQCRSVGRSAERASRSRSHPRQGRERVEHYRAALLASKELVTDLAAEVVHRLHAQFEP